MSAQPRLESIYEKLIISNESFPHAILGLVDGNVIRIWRPGAESVNLKIGETVVQARKILPAGLFQYKHKTSLSPFDYQVQQLDGSFARDPYAFEQTVRKVDLDLYAKGEHHDLYRIMGARRIAIGGVEGIRFVVWAPAATRVSVVGDFNRWDGRTHPLSLLGQSGVWELFVPGLETGARYKFEIRSKTGEILLKADPFALSAEKRPHNSSVAAELGTFQWTDEKWMEARGELDRPMAIYEVHLGSWRQKNERFYNYRDIAPVLADYVLEMGFTHIELLPITEHPLDESWGYQVSGYFACTRRYGTPEDFQYFVNYFHERGIGIILDWVPAHFPTDVFSLGRFDGTPLYEHEDPRLGYHPHWETLIFEFGHPKVSNFLIASALYWLKEMHIDGLRVDAVASMLYLDYGRHYGEWEPNRFGGHENLEAIDFFKRLNSVVHQQAPGSLMIAEESTNFPGVTAPPQEGGLGFDMKWNMGWMNDTLAYFSSDFHERPDQHYHLTFGMMYMFQERYLAPLSHDEVVHEKRSLIEKMPGTIPEKFAGLRLLYSYQVCQPGKFLLFMGGEFGQLKEWDCKKLLDWDLLNLEAHREYYEMVKQMNRFYQNHPALWEKDFVEEGFEWISYSDNLNGIIAYLRKGIDETLLCVHNFQPKYHPAYFLKVPGVKKIQEVFNTDEKRFGGEGKVSLNEAPLEGAYGVKVSVAPLATQIFKVNRL